MKELSNLYLINQVGFIWTYSISEIDWCRVILAFLFRFLLSGIFATHYQYIYYEKIVANVTGLVRIVANVALARKSFIM